MDSILSYYMHKLGSSPVPHYIEVSFDTMGIFILSTSGRKKKN